LCPRINYAIRVAYWPRPSSSTVLEPILFDTLRPRERVSILSLNETSAALKGYIYQVFNTNNEFIGWIPFDTLEHKIKFEYTILAKDKYASVKDETPLTDNNIKLYPNPSNNQQIIEIEGSLNDQIDIVIYDLSGRKIKTVYSSYYSGNQFKELSNISNLSSSIYLYKIQIGEKTSSIKFIKY